MTNDFPTTLNPLDIRRKLGRGDWSTPERQCSRPTSPTGVYGDLSLNDRPVRHSKRGDVMLRAGVATARALLDCPWMTGPELSQAIPPAYTEFIGEQLLAVRRG